MPTSRTTHRIEVMHGINLDMLGRRDPRHYGSLTLPALQEQVTGYAAGLDLEVSFFHSNSEKDYCEHLHGLDNRADAVLLNPGAWTHYAWAIHDALEIAALPAVEVHLSDVGSREPWRRVSVLSDLVLATVSGQGVEGYRDGLARLRASLSA